MSTLYLFKGLVPKKYRLAVHVVVIFVIVLV